MSHFPSIVFFGTPVFATQIFKTLVASSVPIRAIVTQPDRPRGRSLQTAFSSVKQWAVDQGVKIPLFQPEKASDPLFIQELTTLQADLFVVVAYGQILTQQVLDIPPLGCVNVHASLLPKYRGASPIRRALMEGDKETGVTIQKMVRRMDAGDILAQKTVPISPEMNYESLERTLCEASQELLLSILARLHREGVWVGEPQNEAQVSYAPKISVEEGQIDWALPANELDHLIRAFSPKPGAWTSIWIGDVKKRLKVLKTALHPHKAPPGELFFEGDVPCVACGEGALCLLLVQMEGKKAMSGSEWMRGQGKLRISFSK